MTSPKSPPTFLGECRRLGIPVLPPDVNYHALDFDIQKQPDGVRGIRFGLVAIKNAGKSALMPDRKSPVKKAARLAVSKNFAVGSICAMYKSERWKV